MAAEEDVHFLYINKAQLSAFEEFLVKQLPRTSDQNGAWATQLSRISKTKDASERQDIAKTGVTLVTQVLRNSN